MDADVDLSALPELLTDHEVCAVLRISRATFYRRLVDGPSKGEADLRTVRRITVGGGRRWVRESLLDFVRGKKTRRT